MTAPTRVIPARGPAGRDVRKVEGGGGVGAPRPGGCGVARFRRRARPASAQPAHDAPRRTQLGARLGSARLGSARLGSARLGSARLGSARLGSARLGSARLGSARLGSARLGSARLGSARLGSARLGSARLGSARLLIIPNDIAPNTGTMACHSNVTNPTLGGGQCQYATWLFNGEFAIYSVLAIT